MAVELMHELHDAHLVGIVYLPDAVVRLDFRTADSLAMSLTLTGVIHFFCTGMLEGNIVDSVEIIDSHEVSAAELAHFADREGRGQSVEQLRRTISSQQLLTVLLTPSYGAELGCVCSAAQITQRPA